MRWESTITRRVRRALSGMVPSINGAAAGPVRRSQVWSIGIYRGTSAVELAPPEDVSNPVLRCEDITDVPARLIADPFMLRVDPTWYMFFEVLNRRTGKGEIGFATSADAAQWTYHQIVLDEPFHLSYPYVFEWMNDYYMIPETGAAHSVRLYRAARFPDHWTLAGVLLNGMHFVDPSLFRFDGRWWLFAETSPRATHDTLRLYCADDMLGPWCEHPASPIITDNPHIARPAGRIVVDGERVIRYTQDCSPSYGTRVRAFEITTLTAREYCERPASEHPILDASGHGWNGSGMHHVDPHCLGARQWVACVDGWVRNDA
jgi:hypothetical protein